MADRVAARMQTVRKSLIRRIFDNAAPGAINLGLGELQLSMPAFLQAKWMDISHRTFIPYTPNAGLMTLRNSVRGYYHSHEDKMHVAITNGAEEAIFATLTTFVNPGDRIAYVLPSYSAYETIIQMMGGIPLPLTLSPENHFALDWALLDSCLSEKPKLLLLANPSNPLSTALSENQICLIRDMCRKYGVLLVVDEIYRELYLQSPIPSFWKEAEDVLIISGISKSHALTGLRIGWVAGPPALVEPIVITHQYISTCANHPGQLLAVEALSEKGLSSCLDIRNILNENFHYAYNRLINDSHLVIKPQAGFYLFVKVKGDDVLLAEHLAEKGVVTAPGSAFGINGTGWLRLSYGLASNELKKGLDILTHEL